MAYAEAAAAETSQQDTYNKQKIKKKNQEKEARHTMKKKLYSSIHI